MMSSSLARKYSCLTRIGHAAFAGDREAGRHLHAGHAFFEEAHRVGTGEHAAGRDQRNIDVFLAHVGEDLVDDQVQVVVLPVEAEAQVAAGQGAFDDDEVGRTVQFRDLAQEQLQRAYRGHDDAEIGFAEARVVLDQLEGTEVQAGRHGDAVDAGVQRRRQARAQGFLGRVHGQLFHAVHENQAIAFFRRHGRAHVQARRFGQALEVELHDRLVHVVDVELVELGLVLDEGRVELAVRDVLHHRVRDMADTAQARRFQRQLRGRNVHAHSANHDGHIFLVAQTQAEIINTFHCYP